MHITTTMALLVINMTTTVIINIDALATLITAATFITITTDNLTMVMCITILICDLFRSRDSTLHRWAAVRQNDDAIMIAKHSFM